jgi:hypothetical protein
LVLLAFAVSIFVACLTCSCSKGSEPTSPDPDPDPQPGPLITTILPAEHQTKELYSNIEYRASAVRDAKSVPNATFNWYIDDSLAATGAGFYPVITSKSTTIYAYGHDPATQDSSISNIVTITGKNTPTAFEVQVDNNEAKVGEQIEYTRRIHDPTGLERAEYFRGMEGEPINDVTPDTTIFGNNATETLEYKITITARESEVGELNGVVRAYDQANDKQAITLPAIEVSPKEDDPPSPNNPPNLAISEPQDTQYGNSTVRCVASITDPDDVDNPGITELFYNTSEDTTGRTSIKTYPGRPTSIDEVVDLTTTLEGAIYLGVIGTDGQAKVVGYAPKQIGDYTDPQVIHHNISPNNMGLRGSMQLDFSEDVTSLEVKLYQANGEEVVLQNTTTSGPLNSLSIPYGNGDDWLNPLETYRLVVTGLDQAGNPINGGEYEKQFDTEALFKNLAFAMTEAGSTRRSLKDFFTRDDLDISEVEFFATPEDASKVDGYVEGSELVAATVDKDYNNSQGKANIIIRGRRNGADLNGSSTAEVNVLQMSDREFRFIDVYDRLPFDGSFYVDGTYVGETENGIVKVQLPRESSEVSLVNPGIIYETVQPIPSNNGDDIEGIIDITTADARDFPYDAIIAVFPDNWNNKVHIVRAGDLTSGYLNLSGPRHIAPNTTYDHTERVINALNIVNDRLGRYHQIELPNEANTDTIAVNSEQEEDALWRKLFVPAEFDPTIFPDKDEIGWITDYLSGGSSGSWLDPENPGYLHNLRWSISNAHNTDLNLLLIEIASALAGNPGESDDPYWQGTILQKGGINLGGDFQPIYAYRGVFESKEFWYILWTHELGANTMLDNSNGKRRIIKSTTNF